MTCFGRATETAELWHHFKTGRNLLMLAPRRIGKTVQINPRAQAALDRMLDLEKRTYWSTWREHLDRNFPEPERGRLYTVLETVAKSDAGVSRDAFLPALNRGGEPVGEAVLRHLLDTLLADGYLVVDDEHRYAFRMNLLREWWLRYVVL
jgi:uncharacterized protein